MELTIWNDAQFHKNLDTYFLKLEYAYKHFDLKFLFFLFKDLLATHTTISKSSKGSMILYARWEARW